MEGCTVSSEQELTGMPANVVSNSYILPYPDGLHFTEDGLLQGIPLDIVRQEVGELVWHTGGQDVALQ